MLDKGENFFSLPGDGGKIKYRLTVTDKYNNYAIFVSTIKYCVIIFELRNYLIIQIKEKIAVLSHHLTKEKQVPAKDIDLAVKRKTKYLSDPDKYTFDET
jgi:hypothetical protein